MTWTIMHEEGNCTLFPFYFYVEPWGRRLEPILGENLDMLFVLREGYLKECVNAEQYERVGRKVFESIPEKFVTYMEQTDFWLAELDALCHDLESTSDWASKTDDELCSVFNHYCETFQSLNTWGMMITLMEYANSSFVSDKLYQLIDTRLKKIQSDQLPAQVISLLTTPIQSTFFRRMRLAAVRIARKKNAGQDVKELVDDLHRRFAWIAYGYEGPALDRNYFQLQVDNLASVSESERVQIETELFETREKQAALEKTSGLTSEVSYWLSIGRQFMFKKEYRKQLSFRAFYAVEGLQKEMARRAGLSLKQLRQFTPDEIPRVLGGKLGSAVANERIRLVAYEIQNGKIRVVVGTEAESLEGQIKQEIVDPAIFELTGQCAYSNGQTIKGRAKIVMNAAELSKLDEGDLLVSHSTNPNMLSGMKKAAAILTDQGGITCHAAIVSRELKIPCVTGLKVATRLFKDGDLLEVDASAGRVRKIP